MVGNNTSGTEETLSRPGSKKVKRRARRHREAKRNWRKFWKRVRKGFWGTMLKLGKRIGQAFAVLLIWVGGLALFWLASALGLPVELITDRVPL